MYDMSPIPEEIKSGIKLFGDFYLEDLIIVMLTWLLMSIFKPIIHPYLDLPFQAANVCLGIFLIQTSKYDKSRQRKKYHQIYLSLAKDKRVFKVKNEEAN